MIQDSTARTGFSLTRAAARTAAVYSVFGVLWIRFSDLLLASLIQDTETLTTVQTYKGWVFILVTAGLLYGLVRRNLAGLRRYEASLRTSDARLEGLFKAASHAAFVLSKPENGRLVIEAVSPGAIELFGLSGSLKGRPVDSLGLPARLFDVTAHDGTQMVELLFVDAAGAERCLLTNVLALEGDMQGAVLSVALDMTERRNALVAFEKNNLFVRSLLDALPYLLVGVDEALRVTHWNVAAEALTGVGRHDALGRPCIELLPLMEPHKDIVNRCVLDKEHCEFSIQHETQWLAAHGGLSRLTALSDAPQCTYEVQVSPLESGGAVMRLADVSERVRLQEMVVQSEKMMSVGGLAAGMAHEINNPLGGVLQGVQNIRRRLDPQLDANTAAAKAAGCDLSVVAAYMDARGITRMLDGVFDSGKRAAEIVSHMLEFSRSAELSHEVTDLPELVERAVAIVEADYDHSVGYDFHSVPIRRAYMPDMPQVSCSRVGMEQVLVNLFRNAGQALATYHPGGDWSPEIAITVFTHADEAVLEVRDNGPGLQPEQARRVFEPFYTTRVPGKGTGLGLAVSYYIITANHGGSFELQTEPGHGALFRIRLPLS